MRLTVGLGAAADASIFVMVVVVDIRVVLLAIPTMQITPTCKVLVVEVHIMITQQVHLPGAIIILDMVK